MSSIQFSGCWAGTHSYVNSRKFLSFLLTVFFPVVSIACLTASVFSYDGSTRDVKLIPWLITRTSPHDYYGLLGFILNGNPYRSYLSPACIQYFCYDCQNAGTVSFALNLTSLSLAFCFLIFAAFRISNNTRNLKWICLMLALLSCVCSGTSYSYFHTVCHKPLLDAGHNNVAHGHGMNLTLTGFVFVGLALGLSAVIDFDISADPK